MGVIFPFRLYTTPEMVALTHGAEALSLGFWPLWCLVSQGNSTIGDDTQRFSFVGDGFGSDCRVVLRCGRWQNILRRHWLVASGSPSGSYLKERGFSLMGVCLRGVTGYWLLSLLVLARSKMWMRNA